MKPVVIPETTEERDKRKAHTFIDSIFSIYHFHKPDRPRFKPTPQEPSALYKELTKLAQELPKKPIPGQFPITP